MEDIRFEDDPNEDRAVVHFRTYLQINTSHPNPAYAEAEVFHKHMAKTIGLDHIHYELTRNKPVTVLTWKGSEPDLPSVMLYSHVDVVPVVREHWKYPPFGAYKDKEGNIYARGAQDMKCCGMQYLEALRRMKKEGVQPKRTIHIIFGPDEEIGGVEGMKPFVKMQEFKDLNIGFAMDEGLASPTDEFRLFHGERSTWWVEVTFTGNPGHGSGFIPNTAVAKVNKLVKRALEYRAQQEERLISDPAIRLGDVTTLNVNMLNGGVQPNVVPSEMSAVLDIRVAVDEDLQNLEEMLHQWCKEISSQYKIKFLQKSDTSGLSPVDDSSPWWRAFDSAVKKLDIKITKEVFPAGTDGRFVRALGIPVYGFSPMNNTPILLHDHNEFLNEKVFLRGIDIYKEIITTMANVPAQ